MTPDFDNIQSDHRYDLRALLRTELRWFMRLRWVAGCALVVGAGAELLLGGPSARLAAFLLVGLAVLLYNGVAYWADHHWPGLHQSWRGLLRFAAAQIYLDLIALMALIGLSGGLHSPAMWLVVLHMVFVGMLQPRKWVYAAVAIVAAMLAATLAIAGELPTEPEGLLFAAGFIATVAGTAYMTDRLAHAMFRRERSRLRHHRQLHKVSRRLREQQLAMIQHEKMAAMGRLAAGVAHEINNPLSNMDSVLQLMQRSHSAPPEGAVTALRDQIQRIHETVRQLTAFAHPDKGRPERMRAKDLLQSSLKLLDFDRRLDAIEIEFLLTGADDTIRVAPNAMRQVIMNLIANAVDALADAPEPRIELRTARTGDELRIEIADNGVGIEPEQMERIFDPFVTTKPVGKGTGLGLSISLGLVQEQGGSLEARSTPGEGATFIIRLPVAAPGPESGGGSGSTPGATTRAEPTD